MPFTFAHPAAVLPLARRLWLPGLVAGSLAPDVAYYVPLPGGELTHEPLGLVTLDVLLGLVLVAAGYAVLGPVLALGPAGLRDRVPRPAVRVRWPGAVVAIVVGAATHLLWDAFTHTAGFMVRHWPLLRVPVTGPHRLYNVVGYVSSVLGLVVLGVVAARWYRRTPRADRAWPVLSRAARTVVFAGLGVGLVAGALLGLTDPVSRVSGYDWVRCLLLGAVRGFALAATAYVLAWTAISRTQRVGSRTQTVGSRADPPGTRADCSGT
ncbi:DUF4184 family protein [Amycolatopsis sp. RTGN1]|uniref:DUF4184 family protein n=1 Tax=Amycolatopsis ponsaeliensis TaxID=2992142 RepID=UPI00254E7EAF|nr:DUF4184 family protein [Amycolatopsis sp. RTGN1]